MLLPDMLHSIPRNSAGCQSSVHISSSAENQLSIEDVAYAISCEQCKCVVYVGETELQVRERIVKHLRFVRLNNDKPVNKVKR